MPVLRHDRVKLAEDDVLGCVLVFDFSEEQAFGVVFVEGYLLQGSELCFYGFKTVSDLVFEVF